MHKSRSLTTIALVLFLSAQPLAVADPPVETFLAECPTGVIDNVLQSIGTTETSGPAPGAQNDTDDDAGIFPSYLVCNDSVEGGCTASENVDITVTGTVRPTWRFWVEAKTDINIDVTTYIHCEGVVEADILHRGGLGIRSVETLIGDAVTDELRGSSHCQYLAQVDTCRTHHEGQWTADRVIPGRLISSGGAISVCGPLSIYNGEGAVVNTGATRSLPGLITDSYDWMDGVCGTITFAVRDDGALFL